MAPPSPYRPRHPLAAAKPTRHIFDAWNSSSTGHQRADNSLSGSTSWRESRSRKLAVQFSDVSDGGGERLADTVGAGSEGWGVDGRLENGGWELGARGLRESGQRGVGEMFGVGKAKGKDEVEGEEGVDGRAGFGKMPAGKGVALDAAPDDAAGNDQTPTPTNTHPQILRGLTIYINGSTFPLISDHRLKQLITRHGGRLSIHLGRTIVTHVIIGTPSGHNPASHGAGGGLAGSKIQKEIQKVRGKGVKFVSVEWVLESIRAGKRLPEARFATLKLAEKGQGSVYGLMAKKNEKTDAKDG